MTIGKDIAKSRKMETDFNPRHTYQDEEGNKLSKGDLVRVFLEGRGSGDGFVESLNHDGTIDVKMKWRLSGDLFKKPKVIRNIDTGETRWLK